MAAEAAVRNPESSDHVKISINQHPQPQDQYHE
jgi:hypothetical protein